MNRRNVLHGAFGIAAGSAGCVGIGIDVESSNGAGTDRTEVLSANADAVPADTATVERTGYERDRDITFSLTQTVSIGDQSYVVRAVSNLTEYKRTMDHPRFGTHGVARFTAVATPEVELFSKTIDFADQVTTEAMGNGLQSGYERVEIDDEVVDTHSITLFERDVSVSQHSGVAELAGGEAEIEFHIARTVHGTDYVTLVGLYPRSLARRERENIRDLMESVD